MQELDQMDLNFQRYLCCVSRLSNMTNYLNENLQKFSTNNSTDNPTVLIPEEICNSTTEQKCQQIMDSLLPQTLNLKFILIIILILLFIIGSTGNICVILCVTLFRSMRTISHVFLLNLACSDLLVILMCEPFTIALLINPDWIFGETLCCLTSVFQGTSVGVSVLTLTSVCIERYIVIVGKGFNNNKFNSKHLIAWVIGIWITSFLITSPLFQAHEVREKKLKYSKPIRYCLETWSGQTTRKQIFTTIIFIWFYLLPLLFMFVLYSKVGIHLRRSTNTFISIEAGDTAQSLKSRASSHAISLQSVSKLTSIKGLNNTRQRISKLLMILTLLFAIFWLPYHALNLFFDFVYGTMDRKSTFINYLESAQVTQWLSVYAYKMAQILAYVNNAINPLCTLIISKKFRTVLNRLRKCQLGSSSDSRLSKTLYYSQTGNTAYKNC